MKGIVSSISILISVLALAGCNSMSQYQGTSQQADFVKIGTDFAPRGCQYRGEVNSGLVEYMPLESHDAVQANQINILREQAYRLGANTVIVTHHSTTYYGQYIVATGQMNYGIDSHNITGHAYYCPNYAKHQVHTYDRGKITDLTPQYKKAYLTGYY